MSKEKCQNEDIYREEKPEVSLAGNRQSWAPLGLIRPISKTRSPLQRKVL